MNLSRRGSVGLASGCVNFVQPVGDNFVFQSIIRVNVTQQLNESMFSIGGNVETEQVKLISE